MPVPPQLEAEIESLRESGQVVEVIEDGTRYYVILKDFELPEAYSPRKVDVMVMPDYQYPQSRLDMYWTDSKVRLVASGNLPQNAEHVEGPYGGRMWQRWSWHYPQWNPSCHNLTTHLEVFVDRLARGN
jgi:hypothetical protein